MRIAAILGIEKGITSITGSGGKTTLMYVLAEELMTESSVILCTSTHIIIPKQYELVTGGEEELAEALLKHRAVCVGTAAQNGATSFDFNFDFDLPFDFIFVKVLFDEEESILENVGIFSSSGNTSFLSFSYFSFFIFFSN